MKSTFAGSMRGKPLFSLLGRGGLAAAAVLAFLAPMPAARAEWQPGLLFGSKAVGNDWDWPRGTKVDLLPSALGPAIATNTPSGQKVWVYKGQIRLPGTNCWFAEHYDNRAEVWIDNQQQGLSDKNPNKFTKKKFAGPAGWHDIEIRFYHTKNSKAPKGLLADGTTPCGFGICTNEALYQNGPASMADCVYPADPGDQSLFRYDDGTGFWEEGLFTAVSPANLSIKADPPVNVWTTDLTNGSEVSCTAPLAFFTNGFHYTCIGCTVETNADATNANQWVLQGTSTNTGTYAYRHGATAGRVTWLYIQDGYRLDAGLFQPHTGSLETNFPPTLSDGCHTNGARVTLAAVPASDGFRFIHWLVDGAVSNAGLPEIEVAMDQPHTVLARFESVCLTWDGGEEDGVWREGGGGWLAADGTPTNWSAGATAVFTNAAAARAAIDAAGVAATAVRAEGAAVAIAGGALTLFNESELVVTNAGASLRIEASIAGEEGLAVRSRGEPGSCVIAAPADFAGTLAVEEGRLEFDGAGALGKKDPAKKEWAFSGEIKNNGLLVTPHVPQVFKGGISGTGDILVTGLPDEGRIFVPGVLSGSETLVETNRTLASFTTNVWNIRGTTAGTGIPADRQWEYCFISNAAPDALTFDLQIVHGNQTKCLVVELRQTDTGIVARATGSFYRNGKVAGQYRHDAAGWTAAADPGYAVKYLDIFFASSVATFHGPWNWSNNNTLTITSNALVHVITVGNGLPRKGRIEVFNGGELFCDVNNGAGVPNPVHLGLGGLLTLGTCNSYRGLYGDARKLYINNGIIRNLWKNQPNGCTGNDFYQMFVTNGVTIEGYPLQLGDLSRVQSVEVRGNAPLIQNAGYSFSSRHNTTLFTMNVNDVTGDTNADMIVSGPILGDNSDQRTMVKTGPGTLVYSGQNSYIKCTTRIDEGVLRFETDSAMGTNGTSIVLNQANAEAVCVLDIGSSVNTVGTLGLTGLGGTLDVGEGGSITFVDSAEVEWKPGATLLIDGDIEGNRIRFGTDANGLTAAQIEQIKLKDNPGAELYLDADGWLRMRPPTVIWIIP